MINWNLAVQRKHILFNTNGKMVSEIQVSMGDTSTTTWEILKDIRQDEPKMTVRYIVRSKVSR